MLGKAADFYEAEVDEMVAGLSSLMEPIIIVILGTSSAASWCRCTCPSSSWARWSDAGSVWMGARLGGLLGLLIGSFLNVVIHRLPG
jgi:hypothetical protein